MTLPQRILSLWLPLLPTERILRHRFGRSWRSRVLRDTPPLVVSHREDNAQRIASLDAQASALRLKPGMGIAEARAMHPAIEVVEADPEADRRLLESLADWCDRYTPLVAIDGADGLLLDITGCAHLFGGERALLEDLLTRLFHQGFEARAAGIRAMMPYIDEFRPVHSLDSLADLAAALAAPKRAEHDPRTWLKAG